MQVNEAIRSAASVESRKRDLCLSKRIAENAQY